MWPHYPTPSRRVSTQTFFLFVRLSKAGEGRPPYVTISPSSSSSSTCSHGSAEAADLTRSEVTGCCAGQTRRNFPSWLLHGELWPLWGVFFSASSHFISMWVSSVWVAPPRSSVDLVAPLQPAPCIPPAPRIVRENISRSLFRSPPPPPLGPANSCFGFGLRTVRHAATPEAHHGPFAGPHGSFVTGSTLFWRERGACSPRLWRTFSKRWRK